MLTDAKIRSEKTVGKYTDSGGLYLEVMASGSKLWRYRYRIAKKENVYALGEYAKEPVAETLMDRAARIRDGRLTLLEARTERDKCRALVKLGIHPSHHRKTARAAQYAENENTFKAVAKEWIADRKPKWSAYYLRQVERFLAADVYPYIGALPLRSVTAADLLEILRRVTGRGAMSVAVLLRQWLSAIFRYGVATLRADSDPAAALKGALSKPKVKHSRPLTAKDIPGFIEALGKYGGYRGTVIGLRLLLLTFVRTVELRSAEWSEFDLDAAVWRIPPEHTKMRELHIVPLAKQATVLLRELHTLSGGQRFLFPNLRTPKTFMTATTMNRALERMGYAGRFSAHGFRATASTMLNELGYRPDVIERQLAHAERNKVRASYNQAEYLTERTSMMQVWADMVDEMAKADSKVVAGRFQKAAA